MWQKMGGPASAHSSPHGFGMQGSPLAETGCVQTGKFKLPIFQTRIVADLVTNRSPLLLVFFNFSSGWCDLYSPRKLPSLCRGIQLQKHKQQMQTTEVAWPLHFYDMRRTGGHGIEKSNPTPKEIRRRRLGVALRKWGLSWKRSVGFGGKSSPWTTHTRWQQPGRLSSMDRTDPRIPSTITSSPKCCRSGSAKQPKGGAPLPREGRGGSVGFYRSTRLVRQNRPLDPPPTVTSFPASLQKKLWARFGQTGVDRKT